MKRILVIGDSISMGYTPHLKKKMATDDTVFHPAENCGDSRNVRKNFSSWLGDQEWDTVIFNAGLHDIKRHKADNTVQVPLAEYKINLGHIFPTLLARASNVIWVTITPVIEERHNLVKEFHRYNSDVLTYNEAALTIAQSHSVPICDLHTWVSNRDIGSIMLQDGVHFNEIGYAEMADYLYPLV